MCSHVGQEGQFGARTTSTLQQEAHLGSHGYWDQQRTGQAFQERPAFAVPVVTIIDQRHDGAGIDQDHAAVPGSLRRISSARSARSDSADKVPVLANVRTGSVAAST